MQQGNTYLTMVLISLLNGDFSFPSHNTYLTVVLISLLNGDFSFPSHNNYGESWGVV